MEAERPEIKGEEVRPAEIVGGASSISNMIYSDCEIVGPAVFALTGVDVVFHDCRFDDDLATMFVPTDLPIKGTIALHRVTFRRCRFDNIGFIGLETAIEQVAP